MFTIKIHLSPALYISHVASATTSTCTSIWLVFIVSFVSIIRWEQTVEELEEKMGYLAGDVLIASAFLSYTGPFLSNYRDDLVQKQWMAEVRPHRDSSTVAARAISVPL